MQPLDALPEPMDSLSFPAKLSFKSVLRRGLMVWAAALAGLGARADISIGCPFSSNMVLQQQQPVPIWGAAAAGEHVTVEFAGQSLTTVAGADGRWRVVLAPLQASAEGRSLTVRGNNGVTLENVLVGEVWLCSGQSNMEVGLDRSLTSKFTSPDNKQAVVARIEKDLRTPIPRVRLLRLGTNTDDSLKNLWTECTFEALRKQPSGRQGFSAVGFYFGRKLQTELGVPVGLIVAAVGGTVIETWTPPDGKNYRALVGPLPPLAIRGILWYQGESNVIAGDSGADYAGKMLALIDRWRSAWHREDLPFYFVQLPPMPYSKRRGQILLTPEALPQLREGQSAALQRPHTGMVVTTDLAEAPDLHPANKWDVGERLANLALAKTYGRSHVAWSGPVFAHSEVKGSRVTVTFDQAADGLTTRDGKAPTEFRMAGADRKFFAANAVLDGNTVTLTSPEVAAPVAARFAWHEESRPNLVNRAGLPARPFRTDDWPIDIVREETVRVPPAASKP